jgi:hypothetical protein
MVARNGKIWFRAICALALLNLCAIIAAPAASAASITKFDPPGSMQTEAFAINAAASIAGSYLDQSGNPHGFLRTSDGTITSFDPPNSLGTDANGINDTGWIAGEFVDSTNWHGYLRAPDGTITVYDAPGGAEGTYILGLNNNNAYAGTYWDGKGVGHGFVVNALGKFRSFDPPQSNQTFTRAISSNGAVTGYYGAGGTYHGFVRYPDGNIVTFDPPQSTVTYVLAINGAGTTTGCYITQSFCIGFTRTAQGNFTSFQIANEDTDPDAINSKGVVTGSWGAPGNTGRYGFLRNPAGTLKGFGPKGANATYGMAINRYNSVAGYYYDSQYVIHGFLRTP